MARRTIDVAPPTPAPRPYDISASAWVETRKQARQKRVPPGIRSGMQTRTSLQETRSMVTPTLSARRVTKRPRS